MAGLPEITDDNTVWPEDQPAQAPPSPQPSLWTRLTTPAPGSNWSPLSIPGVLSSLWRSAVSGATLPGQVAQGQVSMNDPGVIGRVMDMTGLVAGGGLGLGDAPAGSVGMFAGRRAATADLSALDAAKRIKDTPASVLDQTGWFRGPDQKWRFEIPDDQARLTLDPNNPKYTAQLSDVLYHPDFYKAYPDFQSIPTHVDLTNPNPDTLGSYLPTSAGSGRNITLNTPSLDTMLHEIQHGVQQRENFAPGGNTFMFYMDPTKFPDWTSVYDDLMQKHPTMTPNVLKYLTASEGYRRLAGETEARNVAARQSYTPGQRKLILPWVTEEYPRSQQIVLPPAK